jgi:hypothetical protein
MDSRKNKVFLAAIVIVGAIIVLVFLVNKFNVVQKVERFVDDDDDDEEAYEDDDEGGSKDKGKTKGKESFDKNVKSKPSPPPAPIIVSAPITNKPVDDSTDKSTEKPTIQAINDISTKFKSLIDEMDKQLKNKAVSDEIKKKVMTELMGRVESFSKVGDNTSSLISSIIQKYVPKSDNYANAPVGKSMDTIKKYLKDALAEIENMESKNTNVNERFVQSRDVPLPQTKQNDKEDSIEGFENTPHYALY